MALDLPINAPLTDTQAELTAKIGSMKSLLSIPSIRKVNIPKANQISTFDYLLKILSVMGLTPEIVFNAFLTKVFDVTDTFLEEKVIDAIADSIGQKGVRLSPWIDSPNASESTKKAYKKSNREYLKGVVPTSFLQVYKQKIAKDLVVMIFGPRKTNSLSLNTNQQQVDFFINNAVCSEGLFSLSNPPVTRNQDIEFNRIKLKKELEAGEVIYEISCQDVKIKLPEDPGFLFTGGGQYTQPSSVQSPAASLIQLNQYVGNQVQNINNEENANKGGKRFSQILIEKLLSFMSVLVQPYLPSVFNTINNLQAEGQKVPMESVIFSNCDIANDPTNTTKKEFARSLFNSLLKDLLKLLLLLAIKKFKKLVVNYFARTALEKQKRKLDKAKLKFKVFGQISDTASKVEKYRTALSTLNSVLGEIS
jgi:hypothetical protein